MVKLKKLIIACDGESASGKSTAAKLVSKKYKLLLINSGLLYRYCSKMIIKHKPKDKAKSRSRQWARICCAMRLSLVKSFIRKHVK